MRSSGIEALDERIPNTSGFEDRHGGSRCLVAAVILSRVLASSPCVPRYCSELVRGGVRTHDYPAKGLPSGLVCSFVCDAWSNDCPADRPWLSGFMFGCHTMRTACQRRKASCAFWTRLPSSSCQMKRLAREDRLGAETEMPCASSPRQRDGRAP